MKSIFNLSFTESKKVVLPKNKIFYSSQDMKELAEGFQSGMILRLIGFGFVLEILTFIMYSKKFQLHMMIIVGFLYFFGVILMFLLRIFPHGNWVKVKKKVLIGFIWVFLATFFAIVPITIRWAFEIGGKKNFYIQIAIVGLSVLISIIKFASLFNTSKIIFNNLKKIIKIMILILFAVCLSLTLQRRGMNNFNLKEILVENYMFVYLCFAYSFLMYSVMRIYITYYYLDKYSRQYRLYYRIPDSIWYFSKEEAEKRNDSVYPPRRKE